MVPFVVEIAAEADPLPLECFAVERLEAAVGLVVVGRPVLAAGLVLALGVVELMLACLPQVPVQGL